MDYEAYLERAREGLRQVIGRPIGTFFDHVAQRGDEGAELEVRQRAEDEQYKAQRMQELQQMWEQVKQNGLFSLREQPVRTGE